VPKEQVIDPSSMVACTQMYNVFLKMKSITVVECRTVTSASLLLAQITLMAQCLREEKKLN
jgi:hypothetical protein